MVRSVRETDKPDRSPDCDLAWLRFAGERKKRGWANDGRRHTEKEYSRSEGHGNRRIQALATRSTRIRFSARSLEGIVASARLCRDNRCARGESAHAVARALAVASLTTTSGCAAARNHGFPSAPPPAAPANSPSHSDCRLGVGPHCLDGRRPGVGSGVLSRVRPNALRTERHGTGTVRNTAAPVRRETRTVTPAEPVRNDVGVSRIRRPMMRMRHLTPPAGFSMMRVSATFPTCLQSN